MHHRWMWAVALGLVLAPTTQARQSAGPSTRTLVERAAAYVAGYQRDFAFLIADERMVQEARGIKDDVSIPLGTRTTVGEVFITYLERPGQWTIARDIAEVDGRPVANRVDLAALLSREAPDVVARRLFALNARYNIGGVVRNFSDPFIALLTVSETHRPRFRFGRESADRDEAPGLATLTFRERERPTLVRPETGGAAYAQGSITLDASTGTIHRTRFAVRYQHIEAELTTAFSFDDRVRLWVPTTLSERYTARANGLEDLVTVESAYTNYRRFEAGGRLIAPAP